MRTFRLETKVRATRLALIRAIQAANQGLNLVPQMPRVRGLCSIPGCGRPHYSLGYCQAHYKRKRQGQDLNVPIGGIKRRLREGANTSVATKVSPRAVEILDAAAKRNGVSRYVFLNMLLEEFVKVEQKHETAEALKSKGRHKKKPSSKRR